jgi:hypothetical protein
MVMIPTAFEYLIPALITNFEKNIKIDNSLYAEFSTNNCKLGLLCPRKFDSDNT